MLSPDSQAQRARCQAETPLIDLFKFASPALGKGDHTIEAVRYSPAEQTIWINADQSFRPVSQAIWEFRIGSHQVLEKYLKSRKGRTLSLDEINHVAAIADSLAFTIEQMAKIDKAYTALFPKRG